MSKIDELRGRVEELYKSKKVGRDEWADWMFCNHIFLVSDSAGDLAKKYGADKELSQAAGMLHDIADAVMERKDPGHEEKNAEIARKLLEESGFTQNETKIIVDDAMKFHSCHGDERPKTLEGKAMTSADAIIHLQSNFYEHALNEKRKDWPLKKIKKWAIEKIERDFNKKIIFEDLKKMVANDYKKLLAEFSAL